jgi:spermidine synthase
MIWEVIDNAATVDGDDLVLSRLGDEWAVHTGPTLLMSSELHSSEEALAELTLEQVDSAKRVLVGGLGMGFTLRAALDHLPSDAQVVLAETSSALIRWNRTHLGLLAGDPLMDARVQLQLGDVSDRIAEGATNAYDVILLDVDNGPNALVHATNDSLYSERGSRAAHAALRPGGALAVWSRWPDDDYTQLLREVGFDAESITIMLPDDAMNTIFLARKPLAGRSQKTARRSAPAP